MRATKPSKLLKNNILVSTPDRSEEEDSVLGRDPNDESNKYVVVDVAEEVKNVKVGDDVIIAEYARGVVLKTEEGTFLIFREAEVEGIW